MALSHRLVSSQAVLGPGLQPEAEDSELTGQLHLFPPERGCQWNSSNTVWWLHLSLQHFLVSLSLTFAPEKLPSSLHKPTSATTIYCSVCHPGQEMTEAKSSETTLEADPGVSLSHSCGLISLQSANHNQAIQSTHYFPLSFPYPGILPPHTHTDVHTHRHTHAHLPWGTRSNLPPPSAPACSSVVMYYFDFNRPFPTLLFSLTGLQLFMGLEFWLVHQWTLCLSPDVCKEDS